MKLNRIASYIFVFLAMLLVVPGVYAYKVKSGDFARLDRGQVVDGSLFISGSTVVVDGIVRGDVYCVGQQVQIIGEVDGDVICAGQSISIAGNVAGNIRLVGQNISVTGNVKRNASVLSQSLAISSGGAVSGEVISAGESLIVDGVVEKTVLSAYRSAVINGQVYGSMKLAVDTLTLGDKATVSGKIDYTSDNQAVIPGSASVSGGLLRTTPPKDEKPTAPKNSLSQVKRSWPASAWPSIVFYLIIGLITVAVFPKYTARVMGDMTRSAVPVGLKGALVLMATPVIMFVLFITILGIPLAFTLLMLYCFGIAISRIFVAGVVGAYILDRFDVKQKANVLLQMLVGVPILWFMFKAPVIGGFIGFIAVCWGLGGMVSALGKAKK